MKYTPKEYAHAFGELASRRPKLDFQEEVQLLKNFLRTIEKHNDTGRLEKIFEACERFLRAKEGLRKVVIETARPIANIKGTLSAKSGSASGGKGLLKPDDIVEEKTDPSLVAGVKITVNDQKQFDASLATKLKKIFTI